MGGDQPNSPDSDVARQIQIDAICVRFEQEWQSGKRPSIEELIAEHDDSLRSVLLGHLLQIEFEQRKILGESWASDEFLARFPHDAALVGIAFEEHAQRLAAETDLRPGSSELRRGDSLSSRSDSSVHGRFLPGTKTAGRYRIVSLLGKGGMGEVYRADDLRLGHTVALKFLPKELARDQERLERFQAEVRLTRQISHPNICRVYDMDEVDGQQFLSMEFIDGEDLRILLRRIGRLPKDKGIQIAQQLCAGLAAAHDKGVLHCDLKPANIMIDGRGQVRITDFGLAKLASDDQGAEIAGTPAYMAPEQLVHGKTTIQSDLYSLGLILHELFTGEAVHHAGSIPELIKQHEDSSPSKPSSIVDDLDPAVERVILRCLEIQPHERPKSAHAVAHSLPGGDPIAAALAAGETPSPEMVAAAGGEGGLQVQVAAALMAATLVGLGIACWISKVSDLNRIGVSRHPQALVEEARDIIRDFGYEALPTDEAWGFSDNRDYTEYLNASDNPAGLIANLETEQPPPTEFWYRHSPVHLEPQAAFVRLDIERKYFASPHNPPLTRSGMILVRLDMRGRLYEFRAAPRQRIDRDFSSPLSGWFDDIVSNSEELLGFSLDSFEPIEPRWDPRCNCDEQRAWEGSYPNGIPVRVEAASYRGRPVYLHVIGEWTRAEGDDGPWPEGTLFWDVLTIINSIAAVLMLAAAFLTYRHFQSGRLDRRGAMRVALLVMLSNLLMWLLRGVHVPSVNGESQQLALAVGSALFAAGQMWLFYSAMEPYVRRYWPRTLISWSRLLNGQFRDRLVGQHILVGAMFGIFGWLYERLMQAVFVRVDGFEGEEISYVVYLPALVGTSTSISGMIEKLYLAVYIWLFVLFFLLILRFIVRRQQLAAVCLVGIVVLGSQMMFPADQSLLARGVSALMAAPLAAAYMGLLTRFGLLAACVASFCYGLLLWPITTDTSAWQFGLGLGALMVIVTVAGYGFYTAVNKRSILHSA